MLHGIKCSRLIIVYCDDDEIITHFTNHTFVFSLNQYIYLYNEFVPDKININMGQTLFRVCLKTNTSLCEHDIKQIAIKFTPYNDNIVEINHCKCTGHFFIQDRALFQLQEFNAHRSYNSHTIKGSSVQFINCYFSNIKITGQLTLIYSQQLSQNVITSILITTTIKILHCYFGDIKNVSVLVSKPLSVTVAYPLGTIIIKNTTFNSIDSCNSIITLSLNHSLIEGPVIFKDIIINAKYTYLFNFIGMQEITLHNYIEISNCNALAVIAGISYFILISQISITII